MDINNRIFETGLPEQPLNNPKSLKNATKEEIINIFDEDNNGIITQKEQKNVISRYLHEEYQKYDESIIEQSMKTWIYKDININAEQDQLGIDALKGKINVIKDDIVRNSSKQKQGFGLDNSYNRFETKEEETLSQLADTNNDNNVSNKEMVDFIFATMKVDDYPNLTKDDVYNVINFCVENFRKAYNSTTDDEIVVLCKFAKQNLNEYNNTKETPPPSILKEGPSSEECMKYIMRQIMARGLKLDERKMTDAITCYNFDYSGDDSIITLEEMEGFKYDLEYMNSDREGNYVDTHALDFIVNRYEKMMSVKDN